MSIFQIFQRLSRIRKFLIEEGHVLTAFVIIPADLLRKMVSNQWFGNPVIQNTVSA